MKLKYKGLKNVLVFCKGKFYQITDGTIVVSDEEGIELLKNPNIEEVEKKAEETVEEKKATGKKGEK